MANPVGGLIRVKTFRWLCVPVVVLAGFAGFGDPGRTGAQPAEPPLCLTDGEAAVDQHSRRAGLNYRSVATTAAAQ